MAGKAEYKNQWITQNHDRINLLVAKGKKQEIQAHAQSLGKSLNGFINEAIDEKMERDTEKPDGE